MYKELIIDLETGEETIRMYSEAEIAKIEANKAQAQLLAEQEIEEKAKRQALLKKLGITEEEAKLLLGGN